MRSAEISPTGILGQSTLSTDTGATTAAGLKYPVGVLVDPAGTVWIADTQNNRVLSY
jgi:hypothetical protein